VKCGWQNKKGPSTARWLKLIKLGMDTKTVVARFESQRQALDGRPTSSGSMCQGCPYRVLRQTPPDDERALGIVHAVVRGRAARAPESHSVQF